MNFIDCRYENGKINVAGMSWDVPDMFHEDLMEYNGQDVVLGIRPEDIHGEVIVHSTYPSAKFTYKVEICELLGHEFVVHGQLGGSRVIAKVPSRLNISIGEEVDLFVDMAKIHFFDKKTTRLIK